MARFRVEELNAKTGMWQIAPTMYHPRRSERIAVSVAGLYVSEERILSRRVVRARVVRSTLFTETVVWQSR